MLAALAPIGAMAAVVLPGGAALAGTQSYTNACKNGAVPANWDQVDVTVNMTSPAGPVAAGAAVSLTGISMTMGVPGAIFVAGYNLGLLQAGPNDIPATVNAIIDATNSVELSQSTGVPQTTNNATLSTTISDPDGTPGSNDETATDASTTVVFSDQTWHAGSAGTMDFFEHNTAKASLSGAAGGGAIAVAHIPGGLNVPFRCTSGTVVNGAQPEPPAGNAIVTITPAPTVTSTEIAGPLAASAGTDQTVAPGDLVTLHGSGTGGIPPRTFAWTQTAGPSVTLSDSTAASPTFTVPSLSATTLFTFQLQVTDSTTPTAGIATDSVDVTVPVQGVVCEAPGSECSTDANFQATVPVGTLVISTPYTPSSPFDLGTVQMDPTGTYLHASAQFGNPALPANGVTITDARPGSLPWTAQVTAGDFSSVVGGNKINACNLGFTGVSPQYISGNALHSVGTSDVANGGFGAIAGPSAICSTGLKGGPHTFATASPGTGSVYITGVMDLYAPTSTPAGLYTSTVTFTIS